jgi:hypothetical protein
MVYARGFTGKPLCQAKPREDASSSFPAAHHHHQHHHHHQTPEKKTKTQPASSQTANLPRRRRQPSTFLLQKRDGAPVPETQFIPRLNSPSSPYNVNVKEAQDDNSNNVLREFEAMSRAFNVGNSGLMMTGGWPAAASSLFRKRNRRHAPGNGGAGIGDTKVVVLTAPVHECGIKTTRTGVRIF